MVGDVTLETCLKSFQSIGFITPAVIACFGLLGTIMSLLVIPKMKYFIGKIESFLLVCLSSMDLIILTLQILRIFAFENDFQSFRATSEIPQRAMRRILMTLYFIETWIIVLIAGNRFIALCFPFYQGRLNSPKFIKIGVVLVIAAAVALNAVDFSTFDTPFSTRTPAWEKELSANDGYDINTESPQVDTDAVTVIPRTVTTNKWGSYGGGNGTVQSIWRQKWYVTYVMVVDRLLLAFIPCLIILILDISMVSVLIKMSRTRSSMTMQKGVSGSSTAIAILLSVAISYVVINLPYHAFVIHVWYVDLSGDHCNFVKMSLNLAMILNCSVNFVLYFLLSATFRKTLKQRFTDAATCYCRLNISRDENEAPNKVPLIFLTKQNGTQANDGKEINEAKAAEANDGKTPIYRPVPKPRMKKQSTSSVPTSELMLPEEV